MQAAPSRAADVTYLSPTLVGAAACSLRLARRRDLRSSLFGALALLTMFAGAAGAQTTTLIDKSLTIPVFGQTINFQVTSPNGAQFIVGSGIFNAADEGIAFLSGPGFFQVFALTNGTINVDVFNQFTLTNPGAYSFTFFFANANGTTGDRLAFSATVTPLPPPPGYPLPAGAVSWYKAAGNFIDTLGNNNGTPTGSVGFTAGEVGQAFLFIGTDGNNVGAQTNGFPTGSADRTVEGWVQFNNLSAAYYQAVFAYGGPSQFQEFGVAEQGGQLLIDFEYGAVVDPTPIVQGQTYHFAAVYASGTLSLYVNGVLTASSAVTLSTPAGTSLTIGQSTDASAFWGSSDLSGFVDELTFYNRALAPSEISGIYGAGPYGKIYTAP